MLLIFKSKNIVVKERSTYVLFLEQYFYFFKAAKSEFLENILHKSAILGIIKCLDCYTYIKCLIYKM